jgi:hypothetical protein
MPVYLSTFCDAMGMCNSTSCRCVDWFSSFGVLLCVGLVHGSRVVGCLKIVPLSRSRDHTSFDYFGHGFVPSWP